MAIGCWASACSYPPGISRTVEPGQGVPANQAKAELLEFLRRLNVVFNAGVGHDPKAVQRLAGLRVVDWDESDPGSSKMAEKTELDLAELDRHLTSDPGRPGLHYVLGWRGPGSFLLNLRQVSQISCVTVNEVEAIFGAMEVKRVPRGLPPHGGAFTGPRWQVYSVRNGSGGAALTLSYDYTDEQDPAPTCLASAAIASDAHQ